jgi:hypothetical protein
MTVNLGTVVAATAFTILAPFLAIPCMGLQRDQYSIHKTDGLDANIPLVQLQFLP